MSSPSSSPQEAPVIPAKAVDFAQVRALIEPLVNAHGLVLVDIEWATAPNGRVLRVVIENAEAAARGDVQAGVTLEDCVNVSRDVSTAMDAVDLIPHAYHLEVSSPGLDRPLNRQADFVRHIGRLAKVKLSQPAPDGQLVLRGTIAAAADDQITMEVDGKLHTVPFGHVKQARLVFELERQPKKARAKRRKGSK
jgi:ribosome maturation factor RimP